MAYLSSIVIFQIIGRLYADPDILPRSFDFSLNVESFKEKFCKDCPDCLLKLAVICAQIAPDSRLVGPRTIHLTVCHSLLL